MNVVAIEGVPRDYAWGSTTELQTLLGREPDGRPLAELWFGAHPDAASPVPALGTTLDAMIAADPSGILGDEVVARFGPRLPFLVKLLAADKPLSIQVHPNLAQAEAGFAREAALGTSNRSYSDRNHKPELLCALTPFTALCGFRPVADTLRLLDAFGLPELEPVRELLTAGGGLRAAFTYLLTLPDPGPLVTAVSARAEAVSAPEWSGAVDAVRVASEHFPGDVGVVLTLLLNPVRLQPGEAIYLAAGVVHCYLSGVGVEVMASSDNVLRCGLTPKHVDVDELLRITDFAELADPRWESMPDGAASDGFVVPVPDFRLSRIDLDGFKGSCAVGLRGPHIVLCTAGGVRVGVADDAVDLRPGEGAFVPAREPGFTLDGTGLAFAVTVAE